MTVERESRDSTTGKKPYLVTRLDAISPVPCPCGQARRAFAVPENETATLHLVDIARDSRKHYHEKLTEIYYVLEGRGTIELDDETFPLEPGVAVLIPPGTRHRAVGELRILNCAIPCFDPEDEHFDEGD